MVHELRDAQLDLFSKVYEEALPGGDVGVLGNLNRNVACLFLWLEVGYRICDAVDVNAYDFKCDLTSVGNGNCSILYTVVRATMARQHNSCKLSTLLDRQSRSIPMRCSAIRDNSQKLSWILKLQRGDTSKNAIECFWAYIWASRSCTLRLNSKCKRFPTRTLGTPGACSSTSFNQRSNPSNDHRFVMSYTNKTPWAPLE